MDMRRVSWGAWMESHGVLGMLLDLISGGLEGWFSREEDDGRRIVGVEEERVLGWCVLMLAFVCRGVLWMLVCVV